MAVLGSGILQGPTTLWCQTAMRKTGLSICCAATVLSACSMAKEKRASLAMPVCAKCREMCA
jgi:hypothetical protein